jgi:hypothetical protein
MAHGRILALVGRIGTSSRAGGQLPDDRKGFGSINGHPLTVRPF